MSFSEKRNVTVRRRGGCLTLLLILGGIGALLGIFGSLILLGSASMLETVEEELGRSLQTYLLIALFLSAIELWAIWDIWSYHMLGFYVLLGLLAIEMIVGFYFGDPVTGVSSLVMAGLLAYLVNNRREMFD